MICFFSLNIVNISLSSLTFLLLYSAKVEETEDGLVVSIES